MFQKIYFYSKVAGEAVLWKVVLFLWQECETKIAQEIASPSKEDVSKEEMNENEEVINILLAQVGGQHLPACLLVFSCSLSLKNTKHPFVCLWLEMEGLKGSLY